MRNRLAVALTQPLPVSSEGGSPWGTEALKTLPCSLHYVFIQPSGVLASRQSETREHSSSSRTCSLARYLAHPQGQTSAHTGNVNLSHALEASMDPTQTDPEQSVRSRLTP